MHFPHLKWKYNRYTFQSDLQIARVKPGEGGVNDHERSLLGVRMGS